MTDILIPVYHLLVEWGYKKQKLYKMKLESFLLLAFASNEQKISKKKILSDVAICKIVSEWWKIWYGIVLINTLNAWARAIAPSFSCLFLPQTNTFSANGFPALQLAWWQSIKHWDNICNKKVPGYSNWHCWKHIL